MKKVIQIFIILFLVSCAKQVVPVKSRAPSLTLTDVNIGTVANDGTGDPLRTAFGKVNTNNAALRSLASSLYTAAETRTLTHDSLDALRDAAYDALLYFYAQPDSNTYGNPITRTWFETYGGGGGSGTGGYEWVSWIIGTTSGAPANADTSFTISSFAGDRIELARGTDGDLSTQWLNETATNGKPGYRYNSSGTVVVRPAWSTGDMAYLRAVPSAYTTKIVLSGGGSSLLTSLLGWWDLNETGGSIANDAMDTYHGTHYNSPTLSATGVDYDGINDYTSMGTAAGLRPTGDFTIFLKVNTTQATYGTMASNYISYGGNYYGFKVGLTDAGVIEAGVYYGNATPNEIFSTTVIDNGADHTIIFTYTSSTDVINVYVDGGSSEDTDNVSGTVTYYTTNQFHLGDRGEGDVPFDGIIRKAGIWSKVISSGERTTLQTYSYPFE